ncbi:hypothetical protein ColTof3_01073 [Colletotrichum tofieldiae]|nr:hypothetical protein ColTof3_01073 [Colletotrichum tofieldiae]
MSPSHNAQSWRAGRSGKERFKAMMKSASKAQVLRRLQDGSRAFGSPVGEVVILARDLPEADLDAAVVQLFDVEQQRLPEVALEGDFAALIVGVDRLEDESAASAGAGGAVVEAGAVRVDQALGGVVAVNEALDGRGDRGVAAATEGEEVLGREGDCPALVELGGKHNAGVFGLLGGKGEGAGLDSLSFTLGFSGFRTHHRIDNTDFGIENGAAGFVIVHVFIVIDFQGLRSGPRRAAISASRNLGGTDVPGHGGVEIVAEELVIARVVVVVVVVEVEAKVEAAFAAGHHLVRCADGDGSPIGQLDIVNLRPGHGARQST